ncbi:MAG: hypothetical protein ACRET2_16725, partial [Steroidobacteraceae bacterium]
MADQPRPHQAPDLVPVELPARAIPPPETISHAARAALSAGASAPALPHLAPNDLEGWRRAVQASDLAWTPIADQILAASRCKVDEQVVGGVKSYV